MVTDGMATLAPARITPSTVATRSSASTNLPLR